MAEVHGVIAAVAGVADVGHAVSVLLIRYGYAVASPNKAIIAIEPEVALLSSVLQQLKSCLTDDVNTHFYRKDTLLEAKKTAGSCRKALNDTKMIVDKYFMSDKLTIADRLKRYSKEKQVNLLRAEMNRLKSSIMLMLEVTKFARGVVVGDQPSNKDIDSKILLALADADKEAERRYQTLLATVERPGSIVEDVFANLEISSFSSGGTSQSYAVVDKGGRIISGGGRNDDRAFNAAKITSLINEIEAAQQEIGDVVDHSGIWEICDAKNGKRQFRNTIISKHPKMPRIENVRSIEGVQDQMNLMVPTPHQMTDMYIALMGAVGVGKSTFVNLCCGEILAPVSQSTEHCTESIGEYHFMYTPKIRVHLLDTPGFNDGHRTEREILTDLAEWTSQSLGPTGRLSGIIYFHRISDLGMRVSAHRNLRLFERLCGPDAFHSIILATTNWNFFGDPDTAVMHEQELHSRDEYWGLMLKRGSSVVRHMGDRDSAMGVLGTLAPLQHTKPVEGPYDQQTEPWERKRGLSEAGLALEVQSNEARINQLLAQYTTIVDVPQMARRWSVDPSY